MKTSKHSGVKEEESIDYFAIMRSSEPIESFGIKEFHKRIEAARKEKARKAKKNDGNVCSK